MVHTVGVDDEVEAGLEAEFTASHLGPEALFVGRHTGWDGGTYVDRVTTVNAIESEKQTRAAERETATSKLRKKPVFSSFSFFSPN
jgi:hypothetical protein